MDEKILALLHRVSRHPEETESQLMKSFGSVRGCLTAEYEDIARVLPKDRNTAALLASLRYISRWVQLDQFGPRPYLNTLSITMKFVRAAYVGAYYEKCCLICLDRRLRLIHLSEMATGSTIEVPFYLRQIVEEALRHDSTYVILTHNHPSGSLVFSPADIQVTEQAMNFFSKVGIPLMDHILIGGNRCQSMRDSKLFANHKWKEADPNPKLTEKWLHS